MRVLTVCMDLFCVRCWRWSALCQKSRSRQSLTCLVRRVVLRNSVGSKVIILTNISLQTFIALGAGEGLRWLLLSLGSEN